MQKNNSKKAMQLIGAVMMWAAVIIQFVLMMNNREASVPETILRFFGYFTILTNTLSAIAFTALLNGLGNKWKIFFEKAGNFTAITVYLLVVGIVYNTVLRWLWAPQGMQRLVDELLHLINPLFIFIYWLFFVQAASVKWKDCLPWLWYPLVYCIYTLIRGAIVKFYPYPFMDVTELGYSTVLVNCVYVTIAFFIVAVSLIGIGKLIMRKT